MRALLAALVAAVVCAGMSMVAPQCLDPYVQVDPLLARLWLGKVGEAQPLFAAAPGIAIGYAGVMVAGVAATAWRFHMTRDHRWIALLLLQSAALVLTCIQLRGAYAGAMLAAPGLAAVIGEARRRGTAWLAGAWILSAGMLYPLAAEALTRHDAGRSGGQLGGQGGASCTSPEALAALRSLPPGRLLAPLDLGAYAIGMTRLTVVGAPYYRNNAGNLAVYRFFLGNSDQAAEIVRQWDIRYVAICPDSFAELGPSAADKAPMVALLHRGVAPAWLKPITTNAPGIALYRVEPGLFRRAAAP